MREGCTREPCPDFPGPWSAQGGGSPALLKSRVWAESLWLQKLTLCQGWTMKGRDSRALSPLWDGGCGMEGIPFLLTLSMPSCQALLSRPISPRPGFRPLPCGHVQVLWSSYPFDYRS